MRGLRTQSVNVTTADRDCESNLRRGRTCQQHAGRHSVGIDSNERCDSQEKKGLWIFHTAFGSVADVRIHRVHSRLFIVNRGNKRRRINSWIPCFSIFLFNPSHCPSSVVQYLRCRCSSKTTIAVPFFLRANPYLLRANRSTAVRRCSSPASPANSVNI